MNDYTRSQIVSGQRRIYSVLACLYKPDVADERSRNIAQALSDPMLTLAESFATIKPMLPPHEMGHYHERTKHRIVGDVLRAWCIGTAQG